MSRYTVDTGIEVGFDPPTNVFFAQVFDEEDELLEEVESQELRHILDWVALKGYRLSEGALEGLVRDSEEPWSPGPLQKAMGFEARP